jgi:hypothetical protein
VKFVMLLLVTANLAGFAVSGQDSPIDALNF